MKILKLIYLKNNLR